MKKILLTGAQGQLGRAIRRSYSGESDIVQVYSTDAETSDGIRALDITSLSEVRRAVSEIGPDVIINCAAYTNVDGCEANEDLAYRVNAVGPRNLAIAAEETGAALVHISTDYVFSGDVTKPYDEFDSPSPVSVYGRTKLAGEEMVKEFCRRHYILRTAWLYGEGKNFFATMLALSEKMDSIGVVDDQIGSPTSAAELARVIRYLESTGEYGIYHATCEGQCSWADFAETIFRECGRSTVVERISSEEYKRRFPLSAHRPAFSVLDNRMLRFIGDYRMKEWESAFSDYLKETV